MRGGPGPVVPVDAAPVNRTQVAAWVAATLPPEQRLHRFKWLFQDERASAGGRGSARIAPPDSLRFDVAGPFGAGAASAVVIGDQPLWTEPPDAIAKLVPNYPLLWAMFGVARPPGERRFPARRDSWGMTAWRYAGGGRYRELCPHGREGRQARRRGAARARAGGPRRNDARRDRCAAVIASW